MWAGGATGGGAEAPNTAAPRPVAHDVIVLTPTLDDNFCFGARAEPFEAEAFVAELAVEALGDAILPGLAGLDQRGANALRGDPGQERLGNELRTVVAAQEKRRVTRGERMRPSTSIANPSLVNSSVTVRHLSCWPLAQRSNTKS